MSKNRIAVFLRQMATLEIARRTRAERPRRWTAEAIEEKYGDALRAVAATQTPEQAEALQQVLAHLREMRK